LPQYFPLAEFVQHMEIFSGEVSRPLSQDLEVTTELADISTQADVRRLTVKIRTKGQVTIVTIPDDGLVRWSLTAELPKPRKDCNCHFIKFAQGGEDQWKELKFWYEVKVGILLRAEISSHFTGNFDRPDLEKLAKELGVGEWVAPIFLSTAGVEIRQ
jgi:hypothetical protein